MRICIDARDIGDADTRARRYACSLVRHLARIDHDNEYVVLRPDGVPAPMMVRRNVGEITVPYGAGSRRGAALINALRADVYHAPTLCLPSGALQVPRVVVTAHAPTGLPAWGSPGRRARDATARADSVLADSQSQKRVLCDRFGLAPKRVAVVGEGVSDLFYAAPVDLPPTWDRRPFLFAVDTGDLDPLLRAFAAAGRRHPDLCLRIAGAADTVPQVRRQARRLGLANSVIAEPMSRLEACAGFQRAALFVVTAPVGGSLLPLLEAMAAGCPVLAPQTEAVVEVADGACEWVDAADAEALADGIGRLLIAPARRLELAARGRERAAGFSWDACARRILAAYGHARLTAMRMTG